jgi:hypothetical protein
MAIEFDASKLPFTQPNEKGLVSNKLELSFFSLSDRPRPSPAPAPCSTSTCGPIHKRVQTHGFRVNPRINLPPGRYQLRIGAREAWAAGWARCSTTWKFRISEKRS